MIKDNQVDTTDILLNAAIDAELDAIRMLDVENQIEADPRLRQRHAELSALSEAVQARAAQLKPSHHLRARIEAMAAPVDVRASNERPRSWVWSHQALAASIAGAFCLGLASMFGVTQLERMSEPDRIASVLVDDHRRALLAREPIDVASSDRHTVKPWFDTRLALSPSVVDLSARGYDLVGGRADVVNGVPAPTIVYRVRGHLISVTAIPISQTRASFQNTVLNGYQARSWSDYAFSYWAISDLPGSEMDAFVSAFRAES